MGVVCATTKLKKKASKYIDSSDDKSSTIKRTKTLELGDMDEGVKAQLVTTRPLWINNQNAKKSQEMNLSSDTLLEKHFSKFEELSEINPSNLLITKSKDRFKIKDSNTSKNREQSDNISLSFDNDDIKNIDSEILGGIVHKGTFSDAEPLMLFEKNNLQKNQKLKKTKNEK